MVFQPLNASHNAHSTDRLGSKSPVQTVNVFMNKYEMYILRLNSGVFAPFSLLAFIKFNWFKVDRDLEVFRPEKVYCFPKKIAFSCRVLIFLWLKLNIYLERDFTR